ncbi:hypothetical protein AgCh_007378 [Apium graveolens]
MVGVRFFQKDHGRRLYGFSFSDFRILLSKRGPGTPLDPPRSATVTTGTPFKSQKTEKMENRETRSVGDPCMNVVRAFAVIECCMCKKKETIIHMRNIYTETSFVWWQKFVDAEDQIAAGCERRCKF